MLQLRAKVRSHTRRFGGNRAPALQRQGRLPRRLTRGCVVLLQLAVCIPALCQAKPSDFDVKAAYLLNFGKFLRASNAEPAASPGAFDVCVVGDDPIEASLKSMVGGQSIGNRPVEIVQVKDGTQARNCRIAFLSDAEGARVDRYLEELRGADVLTVGSSSRFLSQGGMVQFLLLSDHVRFAVNLDAVKKTHLVLSSELLRVAYSITGKPATEVTP